VGNSEFLLLLLTWALPLLFVQWLIGLDVLLSRWRVWLPAILVPTVYFTVIDALALAVGVRIVNANLTLGAVLPLLNVPLEDVLLFLLTNTLVAQALLLTMSRERLRARRAALFAMLRRGPERPPEP
jgi:lycopene cyclase domain-containing protein